MPPYTASKHGVHGLTRAAAHDYAAENIRINELLPGVIDTPMLDTNRGMVDQMTAFIPQRRLGQPAEVARAVCFLLAIEASYMTGARVAVDGGFLLSSWIGRRETLANRGVRREAEVGCEHKSLVARPCKAAGSRSAKPAGYSSIRPPSTTISAPVMKDASSESRNATVLAISSGRPMRFIGTRARMGAVCSGFASTRGVRMEPGDTALIRIPRVAYSIATERVRPRTACLLAV